VAGFGQLAIRAFASPVLAPLAAVATALGFEDDLGIAFPGLARQDVIAAAGDFTQARCFAIQGKRDRIHNRRLPAPVGPTNGKQAIVSTIPAG